MSKTLYDLLEVTPSASMEDIVGAYTRLHSTLTSQFGETGHGDQDTLNQMKALREAFNVLSDQDRRQRYDLRLASRRTTAEQSLERAPWSLAKPLLLVGLISICGVGYSKFSADQEMARLEREKIAAEARQADIQLQREREVRRASAQADLQRRRDEARERYSQELALARDDRIVQESHLPDSMAPGRLQGANPL